MKDFVHIRFSFHYFSIIFDRPYDDETLSHYTFQKFPRNLCASLYSSFSFLSLYLAQSFSVIRNLMDTQSSLYQLYAFERLLLPQRSTRYHLLDCSNVIFIMFHRDFAPQQKRKICLYSFVESFKDKLFGGD